MNYTEQELEISNKSYTNKDFNTIYPELLDLVKKLTNKWDPTTSNESDPGVVLLKLWAILADKNNYNIDKNILETFPLSVTQRGNAQKLYDMLGYDMHYYKSATTTLTLWYLGNILNIESPDNKKIPQLTVPKFTMVTDDSGQNTFTTLQDVVFSARALPFQVQAIQGTIHDYEINGIQDITLDNLDSEYRLFFSESKIAENGIFIANKGLGTLDWTSWEKVSNLESATLNSKIYKFGILPNTQACYIQFPQDIGTLIGNGLKIKYIITDGESGNIQANQLTTFSNEIVPPELTEPALKNDSTFSIYYNSSINSDVKIKNTYSAINGADPEDLDSAYKNYKNTIGTFNTLVTTKDYEKAIYNLTDNLGQPEVSNVVVSDRTNNINYSTKVVALNGDTAETILEIEPMYKEVINLYEEKTTEGSTTIGPVDTSSTKYYIKEPMMTAFDLGLYILEPMINIDDDTGYYYNKSFSVPINFNNIISQIDGSIINQEQQYYKSAEHDFIETAIENSVELKSLNPDITTPEPVIGKLPYIFKNFYTLNGKVITYYKVTKDEAESIEKNIKKALFRDYNARKVTFGEKIRYEDIVKTIENADTRIKSLILNEPEYTLKFMAGDDNLGSYSTSYEMPGSEDFTKFLAQKLLLKMILGGNVQLYKFNQDIQFDFGQTNLKKYEDIRYLTTNTNIKSIENGNEYEYKVEKNQNIVLYAPNFYTSTSYGAYVNYNTNGEEYSSGTYYKLSAPIDLNYTDENNTTKNVSLDIDTCIRFVDSNDSPVSLTGKGSLTPTQSIEVITPNEVEFSASNSQNLLYCMWFTNKSQKDTTNNTIKYTLFEGNETQKLLEDNEYFIYTNNDKNELVILGSGTLLVRSGTSATGKISYTSKIPASSIIENGQTAITDNDWYRWKLDNNTLKIMELQIVTLGEGAGLKISNSLTNDTISSVPVIVKNPAYCEDYTKEDWISLDKYNLSTDSTSIYNWFAMSRYNMVTNSTFVQDIPENTTITLYKDKNGQPDKENPPIELTSLSILSNTILAFGGGKELQLSTNNNEKINIYSFEKKPLPSYFDKNKNEIKFKRDNNGHLSIPWQDWVRNNNSELDINDSPSSRTDRNFLISQSSTDTEFFADKIIVPISLVGDNTEVSIGLISIENIKASGNTYEYKFTAPETAAYSFTWTNGDISITHNDEEITGGRKVNLTSGQSIVLNISTTKSSIDLSLNIIKSEIILNSSSTCYLELNSTSSGICIEQFKKKTTSTVTDNSLITDVLKIGYPKFLPINTTYTSYSDQVLTTLKNIDESLIKDDVLGSYIKNNYPEFNITYQVNSENAIDGEATTSNNYNNLFAGDLVWEKNHICNKYTIPQYDFEHSSIKVASTYIKN